MADTPADQVSTGPQEASPTTTASGLANELVPLPNFVLRIEGGLHVALPALDSPARFHEFIDRVFSSGLRFVDLDYACMQRLLYDCDSDQIARQLQNFQNAGKPPRLRLAADIVEFPSERQQYYKDARVDAHGETAEYLFEPVFIEMEAAESTDDASGQGEARARKPSFERVVLNLDEFIAAMWVKGVCFGIDTVAVAAVLAADRGQALEFSRMRMLQESQDASVEELIQELHRDNTPKLLPNGRVDLFQFKNRFPQVEKHARLFRKIPCRFGRSGRDVHGNELPAEMPRDLDMLLLAGIGTRVERNTEGEFVVADMTGFLQLDNATQSVSISEKIVNHDGVSLRTTGNLTLSGDEYEEHGEVEEHTQVEGKNMTFMANVFGNIVSRGGRVLFRKNLTTGIVRNAGGTINVEGNASNTTLHAPEGEISVAHAEGCVIIGKKVTIGQAINCDIYADELTLETAEGCALAGKKLEIGSTAAWHDTETMISLPIPDLSTLTGQLDEYRKKHGECERIVQGKTGEIDAIISHPDVKNYSMVSAKLRAKQITMTREQDANWQKLQDRVAPLLRQLKVLNNEAHEARYTLEMWGLKIEDATRKCQEMSVEMRCTVATIAGETLIRTLKCRPDAPLIQSLQPRELCTRLREPGLDSTTLFNGSEGNFEWTFSSNADNGNAGASASSF